MSQLKRFFALSLLTVLPFSLVQANGDRPFAVYLAQSNSDDHIQLIARYFASSRDDHDDDRYDDDRDDDDRYYNDRYRDRDDDDKYDNRRYKDRDDDRYDRRDRDDDD